ncbi:Lipid II flippase FtsW [Oceanobacillus oncorhynchi]|uniref:Probable peptidoglycan glycosyltransferase FtsW n=1 Tax=Oceanobacillus oncorhynchi TaxID=545501 RepID=A0A0A1MZ82_9BACI|nr:putative lipid II flippase FtsW [Oceanobacillus oncorhynchi]CEI84076.1 Lipid II flippase FtsW [Oceanobacillus oncorhynchi]
MLWAKVKKMDFLLIGAVGILSIFGLLMVYSASFPIGQMYYDSGNYFFVKQLQWLLIGIAFFTLAALINPALYARWSPALVMLSLILLIAVLIPNIGVERNFSQRWIAIGGFLFQPSEVVKISMVIYFASIYAKKQSYINHFVHGVLPPVIILLLVFLFILSQPDLGAAGIILAACGIIVTCSGVKKRHIFLLGSVAAVGTVYFALSSAYRLNRLTSFRQPFEEFSENGYQLANSLLAINSGGLMGNGIGNSTQKLGYLPEAHTDFIMAITIEELGAAGLLIVLACYMIILFRGIFIAKQLSNSFYQLLAIGITFLIMIQAVINLGAISGMLPITGVTLPFVSYGGSSIIIMMVCAGILVNLSAKRES